MEKKKWSIRRSELSIGYKTGVYFSVAAKKLD